MPSLGAPAPTWCEFYTIGAKRRVKARQMQKNRCRTKLQRHNGPTLGLDGAMTEQHQLSISFEVFVPREILFDVWTAPEHLACWHAPGEDLPRQATSVLREGGGYAITWRDRDDIETRLTGEYHLIEPPARLRYSMHAEDNTGCSDTEVEIKLSDLGGKTRIGVQQTGFKNDAERDKQAALWPLLIHELEHYLSAI